VRVDGGLCCVGDVGVGLELVVENDARAASTDVADGVGYDWVLGGG
jgi:hypothetical protein